MEKRKILSLNFVHIYLYGGENTSFLETSSRLQEFLTRSCCLNKCCVGELFKNNFWKCHSITAFSLNSTFKKTSGFSFGVICMYIFVFSPFLILCLTSSICSSIYTVRQSVCRSVIQSVRQSVRQWVRQCVSQCVRQYVCQSVCRSVIQSVIQSVRQSVRQWVRQRVSQCVRQYVHQYVRQPVRQCVRQLSLYFL
jgi:DNA-binding protein Fis